VATVAQRLYPGMTSSSGGSSSQAASSPAPSRAMNDIARSLYPRMASASGPRTTEPGARSGFVRQAYVCDVAGPMRGVPRFVDVPVTQRSL
jgi:hypothetical protein